MPVSRRDPRLLGLSKNTACADKVVVYVVAAKKPAVFLVPNESRHEKYRPTM